MLDKVSEMASTYVERLKDKVLNTMKQPTMGQLSGDAHDKINPNKRGKITSYRTISTIIAITTSFVAPLLEIVLIFLPDLIGFFTKGSKEAKQNEAIRQQILTSIIPDVNAKSAVNCVANSRSRSLSKFRSNLANHWPGTKKVLGKLRKNMNSTRANWNSVLANMRLCAQKLKLFLNLCYSIKKLYFKE